jgi:hypothetical protein
MLSYILFYFLEIINIHYNLPIQVDFNKYLVENIREEK